jgi:hypothetical protein
VIVLYPWLKPWIHLWRAAFSSNCMLIEPSK